MNGNQMTTNTELIKHLDSVVTISITAEVERTIDRDTRWDESDEMRNHYLRIASLRAFFLNMELAPGPVHRWTVGTEVFYSYPVQPAGSALPWRVEWMSTLPKWGEVVEREQVWSIIV